MSGEANRGKSEEASYRVDTPAGGSISDACQLHADLGNRVMLALLQILSMVTNVIIMLVIVQFIIGLLFAFNVINQSNAFVVQLYQSINMVLEPLLAPIRRLLPNTGAIDFSPLVLILLLNAVIIILQNVAV